MSEESQYRWLEQQGEAFGNPGTEPHWTSSMKDAVGTAYSASSRIWFTCSHGVLNEVYHPTIDRPQVRDMEFLVTDGETFVHEEKRDMNSTFEYIDPEALGVRYVNRDPEGRYTLTKEIICDPHHSVVLTHVRLEGDADLLPRLKVYALLAPHMDGGGADNSARAVDIAGRKVLMAWKNLWSLAMAANCGLTSSGFSRVSCGFVGVSDGWRDLMDNFRMDWEFGYRRQCSGNGGARFERRRSGRRDRVHAGLWHRRGTSHGGAKNDGGAGDVVWGASQAVHRSVGAGGESRLAGGEVQRWGQADADQPQCASDS